MPFSRLLGHSTSTVSRELALDRDVAVLGYHASEAAAPCRICCQRCVRWRKVAVDSPPYQHAHYHLNYWRASPQRIAVRLRSAHPDDTDQCICHETIYAPKAVLLGKAAIYSHSRGGLTQSMVNALRHERPTRGHRPTNLAQTDFVPEQLRIVHRAEQIALPQWPGQWEGDLTKGAFNRSRVGTLVERETRFVVLRRMDGCTAKDALEAFTRQMRRLPAFLRRSVIYDSGRGTICLAELAKRLNFDIWSSDSHASWQRGSNENTDGLLRKFLQRPGPVACHAHLVQRQRRTVQWSASQDARLGPEEARVKELEKGQLTKRCTCLLMMRCATRSIEISDLDQGIEILDERLPEPATYEVKL